MLSFTAGFLKCLADFQFGTGLEREGQLTEREKQRVSGAVEFACAVGALTCTSEGAIAAQPTLQQVNDYVSRVRSS